MCAVAVGELDGRPVIVSGGGDVTVRVWELAEDRELVITVRSTVEDLVWDGRGGIVLAAIAGVLRLKLV